MAKPLHVCAESLVPDYSQSSASSVSGNNPIGTGFGQGRLNSNLAWTANVAKQGEWWQMDAGAIVAVSGVQTQPSFVDPRKRVTKYKVSVSTNNESWSWVDGGTIFNESARYVDTATNVFTMPVLARYVRIVVDSWENGNPALRAGLLVLPVWTGALRCPMVPRLAFWKCCVGLQDVGLAASLTEERPSAERAALARIRPHE